MKMPGTTAVPIMLAVFIAGGSVGFRPSRNSRGRDSSPRAERNVNVHERPCASHHRARCGSVTVPLDRRGTCPERSISGTSGSPAPTPRRRGRKPSSRTREVRGTRRRPRECRVLRRAVPPHDGRHDLLLVDLRGTGTSDLFSALRCSACIPHTPNGRPQWVRVGGNSEVRPTSMARPPRPTIPRAFSMRSISRR